MPAQYQSTNPIETSRVLYDSPFMKACRKEKTDYTPVWLMRQAGRFMPEYRQIREKVGFIQLCKDSNLAAEVTVMAVNQLKVDAAIIFADILLPLEAMGVGLTYEKSEGPVIHRPIQSSEDVSALRPVDVDSDLGYVFQSIKLARQWLPPATPLIGFAGAPFTLASYLLEGGASRHFERTKRFMYQHPDAWHRLLEQISAVTVQYLRKQFESGAQAVQLFDSWVGCLSPSDYEAYVLPYSQRTVSGVKGCGPVIHFATGNPALLPLMHRTAADVIGVDWRIALNDAWNQLPGVAIQGNMDPVVLLAEADTIKTAAATILSSVSGKPGHIFNLGHGVLPQTPVTNAQFVVDFVQNWRP